MVTGIIMLIGVLFILNGLTSIGNSKVVARTRGQIPANCKVYAGGNPGLLMLTSTNLMVGVRPSGRIAKAFVIRSGWLRRSRAEELPLEGCRMDQLQEKMEGRKQSEQRACLMVLRNYRRK